MLNKIFYKTYNSVSDMEVQEGFSPPWIQVWEALARCQGFKGMCFGFFPLNSRVAEGGRGKTCLSEVFSGRTSAWLG